MGLLHNCILHYLDAQVEYRLSFSECYLILPTYKLLWMMWIFSVDYTHSTLSILPFKSSRVILSARLDHFGQWTVETDHVFRWSFLTWQEQVGWYFWLQNMNSVKHCKVQVAMVYNTEKKQYYTWHPVIHFTVVIPVLFPCYVNYCLYINSVIVKMEFDYFIVPGQNTALKRYFCNYKG